jgi:hypothetical protein
MVVLAANLLGRHRITPAAALLRTAPSATALRARAGRARLSAWGSYFFGAGLKYFKSGAGWPGRVGDR